jgi:hypothetical protein
VQSVMTCVAHTQPAQAASRHSVRCANLDVVCMRCCLYPACACCAGCSGLMSARQLAVCSAMSAAAKHPYTAHPTACASRACNLAIQQHLRAAPFDIVMYFGGHQQFPAASIATFLLLQCLHPRHTLPAPSCFHAPAGVCAQVV